MSSAKLLLDGTGLPTWPKEKDEGDLRYSWQKPKEAVTAIVQAIDRGILTQDGVVKDGKVVFYG